MAKRKSPPKPALKADAPRTAIAIPWQWIAPAVVLLAYAVPLFSPNASIQWDAVDVHYSAQRYFAERMFHGGLPFWTPYIFSGFPFLADPQTGAWYPGNWIFLMAGAGPKALEAELALHAVLAAAGVFALLRRWFVGSAAAAGALSYSLGGFFAGHSSHIGMFESAALFPWILVALFIAADGRFFRGAFCGTLTGGALVLAGHFQTALYAFAAALLMSIVIGIRRSEEARRAIGFILIVVVGSALLSAIQTLPGLELATRSVRAAADYRGSTEGALDMGAVATLLAPDFLGAKSENYTGPGDVTQYYFYSGFLLLPLVLLGWPRNSAVRPYALALGIPAVLYMAGPALGVFHAIAWLPGFRNVRAPVHAWFVVALALAMLAAAGVEWLESRWHWAGVAVVAVLAFDLCGTNFWTNPLAYAHQSFESSYGKSLDMVRSQVVPDVPALTRFDAPDQMAALGPLNHPLDLRLEATYGYNPLALSHYAEFRQAAAGNPKLRDSLSVSRIADTTGALKDNDSRLPRAYFPKELIVAPNDAESRRALDTLDPPRQAVISAPLDSALEQDEGATVTIGSADEQSYRLRYKTAKRSLIRLGIPYYPGWEAAVDGTPCAVMRADHALMAIVVPAGEKQLDLRFRSTHFGTGAALSVCGILLLAGLGLKGRNRPTETN